MASSTESTTTATRGSEPARQQSREGHEGKHVHHGQTPAAWAGSILAIVGFLLGGISLVIGPNWTLFVIAAVICTLALVAAGVLHAMGHGAD